MKAATEQLVEDGRPDPPQVGEDQGHWRTVYCGRGIGREVGAVVEVHLSNEQKVWLDRLADERGLTLAEAVLSAIDLAREGDQRA